MIEKLSQLAEQAATNVSRRQFLGRVGRGAMIAAAAAGGLLAFPAAATAGRRCPGGYYVCGYDRRDGDVICCPRGNRK
jgi:hypothetical protein